MTLSPSICRFCPSWCSVLVGVEDGRVVSVTGDDEGAIHQGYSCVKGRALPSMINHPDRVLRPQARRDDGFVSIGSAQAMDEIAEQLSSIVEQHGPRSVWIYLGSHGFCGSPANWPMTRAFAGALGTPWFSTPNTIDQPGKSISAALHGRWMAPPYRVGDADAVLLVGRNPLVSEAGPASKALMANLRRGMKLIVIDPRRSDVARRAFLHLQPKPGEDSSILAAMLRVILDEQLDDEAFVTEHVNGIEILKATLRGFSVKDAAARADIDVNDLLLAARTFASARQGLACAGVGPNMSESGTLVEYLLLCLQTVCGNWPSAGELVSNPGTLIPTRRAKAQAVAPIEYRVGEAMRVRGLHPTLAGVPTAAAPDEMLLEGEGQVRALLSVGGNPVAAWPDQLKTVEAIRSLELLVQVDPWMSQTAKLAHYVIPPKMNFESMITTQLVFDRFPLHSPAFGQYAPAVVDPPPGSDVMEEWELFYGLAHRMGMLDGLAQRIGLSPELTPIQPDETVPLFECDLTTKPTSDELLEMMCRGSRIPLDEVKRHPHGQLYPDPPVAVEPKDPGWSGRFDVGNTDMMTDLRALRDVSEQKNDEYPYRLLCRRVMHMFNSSGNFPATNRGRVYNPAFMHPYDLQQLGVAKHDLIHIRSRSATVIAVVEPDESVRPGCISMTHGFGDLPEFDAQVRRTGTPTGRLLGFEEGFDRYSGQPRMSNIPVAVCRHDRLT
jgi:anaerobic selenocysteine-containing dehydrogenase